VNERRRRPRKPGPGGPGRRQPPPDDTGREAALYRELVDAERPVTLRTTDGEGHHGTIVGFDDDHLELRTAAGGSSTLRIALRAVRSIESG
jgi:hypothetical protein